MRRYTLQTYSTWCTLRNDFVDFVSFFHLASKEETKSWWFHLVNKLTLSTYLCVERWLSGHVWKAYSHSNFDISSPLQIFTFSFHILFTSIERHAGGTGLELEQNSTVRRRGNLLRDQGDIRQTISYCVTNDVLLSLQPQLMLHLY